MKRRFRIHPAIGVARMGNSPDHFVAPEIPGVPANWDNAKNGFSSFRDQQGRILRQAVRFRIFEYQEAAEGTLSNPKEVALGTDIIDVEWRVHVANRKASFFVFDGLNGSEDRYVARQDRPATDIVKQDPERTNLRNASVPDAERTGRLDIDPGEQGVSAKTPGAVELRNPNAAIPIESLGAIFVEDQRRLIVVPGRGQSASTETPPRRIDEYASNDTWFDDAGDGSVKARVHFVDGTFIDADPAWVLVGPPDFAPGIGSVVSLYETVWDVSVRELGHPASISSASQEMALQQTAWRASGGKSLSGYQVSFTRDVYPILKRAVGVRSVHVSGVANQNYHRVQLVDWNALARIEGPSAIEDSERRVSIFELLRDPDDATVNWTKMPRGFGDDYTSLDEGHPTAQSFLSLTRIQYALLREWSQNRFANDWSGAEPPIPAPREPTPDDLDRAGLEGCAGGPFFPGIEVGWLIRIKELYSEPFRLRAERVPATEATNSALRLGALTFGPGFFSQQMALPWQADFYDCRKETKYDPDGNELHFMWWTAQRPDDVIPSGGAEADRQRWVRTFDSHNDSGSENPDSLNNFARFAQMQSRWAELKFVVARNGDGFEEEP